MSKKKFPGHRNPPPPPTFGHRTELTTQEFEALKFKVIQRFGKYVFDRTNFTINEAWDHILLQMEAYVMGQHNYQKFTVMQPIPANCWYNDKYQYVG